MSCSFVDETSHFDRSRTACSEVEIHQRGFEGSLYSVAFLPATMRALSIENFGSRVFLLYRQSILAILALRLYA